MDNSASIADKILERKDEVFTYLQSAKDVLDGFYSELDNLFLEDDQLNIDKMRYVASEIAAMVECEDVIRPYYETFLLAVFFYLYAECNPEDRIFLSLLKIAGTVYKEDEREEFAKTTFGIMVSDAHEALHIGYSEVAYKRLREMENQLAGEYSRVGPLLDVRRDIRRAVSQYLDKNHLSCYTDETKFDAATRILHRIRLEVLYLMDVK